MVFRCAELSEQSEDHVDVRAAARTCIACSPLASLTGSPSHEPTQSPTSRSLPRITRLIGVCPNGATPNAYTAAQNAIFASVRANSSGEKFARAPTKSTPGYRWLTSSNVGPDTRTTSSLAKMPRIGFLPATTPGAGNLGVGRYRGNSVGGT